MVKLSAILDSARCRKKTHFHVFPETPMTPIHFLSRIKPGRKMVFQIWEAAFGPEEFVFAHLESGEKKEKLAWI